MMQWRVDAQARCTEIVRECIAVLGCLVFVYSSENETVFCSRRVGGNIELWAGAMLVL